MILLVVVGGGDEKRGEGVIVCEGDGVGEG